MIERDSTDFPQPDSPTMPMRLAPLERERHAVDRAHEPAVGLEVRLDVVDLEQRAVERRVGEAVGAVRSLDAAAHMTLSRTSKRAAHRRRRGS